MLGLYRFYWDCRRQGELAGLCILDSELIEKSEGTDVYFGEVLGKHSEVQGTIETSDFSLLTDDPKVIEILQPFASRNGTICGYNPFDYLEEE